MHVFFRSAVEIMDWFGVESTPKYRTPFPSILECNDTSRKRHFLHTPLIITERKNARHFHNRQLSASLKYIVSKSRTSSFVNAALFPLRVQKSTKWIIQKQTFCCFFFFRAKKGKSVTVLSLIFVRIFCWSPILIPCVNMSKMGALLHCPIFFLSIRDRANDDVEADTDLHHHLFPLRIRGECDMSTFDGYNLTRL